MNRRDFIKTTGFGSLAFCCGTPMVSRSSVYHVVQQSDTLYKIALQHEVNLEDLLRANRLEESSVINPGDRLFIPQYNASKYYLSEVTQSTENLSSPIRNWEYIVLHHSATVSGNASAFDTYHRQNRHMENGLAYHFVIGNGTNSSDGKIEMGSRWYKQLHGGHVRNEQINNTGIGICLVGNFEEDKPTRKQLEATYQLISYLQNEALKKPAVFVGHRELYSEYTLCPGRYFPLHNMHQKFG